MPKRKTSKESSKTKAFINGEEEHIKINRSIETKKVTKIFKMNLIIKPIFLFNPMLIL